MFDTSKNGLIETSKISTILNTMGQLFDHAELSKLISENDPEKMGKVDFNGFCAIASHFLDEEDDESTTQELKEAFRWVCKKIHHFIHLLRGYFLFYQFCSICHIYDFSSLMFLFITMPS